MTVLARPHHSNDNPVLEHKNAAIVRRSASKYRYDTDTELRMLNELWSMVILRRNLFLATKKATGYHLSRKGETMCSYNDCHTWDQQIHGHRGHARTPTLTPGRTLSTARHDRPHVPDQRDPATLDLPESG
ncbi:hypothetical protein [Arthrobacter psychrolactophilus]|uniref:hypothetical protein n=1 Tax=Arthrobacter psychrolactophilus TaxID=92442 RepID=UPI0011B392A2|nr:hypothetical protein [Arthrobacter psychrolactophilus]